jgi:hypothetical protein
MSFHATVVGLPAGLDDALALGAAGVEAVGVGVPVVGVGEVVHPAHRRSAKAVVSRCFMGGLLHR